MEDKEEEVAGNIMEGQAPTGQTSDVGDVEKSSFELRTARAL